MGPPIRAINFNVVFPLSRLSGNTTLSYKFQCGVSTETTKLPFVSSKTESIDILLHEIFENFRLLLIT